MRKYDNLKNTINWSKEKNIKDQNNIVELVGTIQGEPKLSHIVLGEEFYVFYLGICRSSGYVDIIPVTASKRLICNLDLNNLGQRLRINGQLRSYNKTIDDKNKLVITIFAKDIEEIDNREEVINNNIIFLDGHICKDPVYRETPLGREIADILLAVNRSYRKSDYLPLITWGRNARYSDNIEVGDRVQIVGRIQSREYKKKISENEDVTKVAYEVSISRFIHFDENNRDDELEKFA